jgi:formylglycine-generating enzyme required for sulfatase activity
MIHVDGGTFTIGSTVGNDDEKPPTKITLPSYYIAETQVTQALWRAVMDSDPISLHNKGVMNAQWIM